MQKEKDTPHGAEEEKDQLQGLVTPRWIAASQVQPQDESTDRLKKNEGEQGQGARRSQWDGLPWGGCLPASVATCCAAAGKGTTGLRTTLRPTPIHQAACDRWLVRACEMIRLQRSAQQDPCTLLSARRLRRWRRSVPEDRVNDSSLTPLGCFGGKQRETGEGRPLLLICFWLISAGCLLFLPFPIRLPLLLFCSFPKA
jgi:hypothetical protein